MAVQKVITSLETENELSVFINPEGFLTIKITEQNSCEFSIFCFKETSDAEEFLIILRDAIIEYKKLIQ